MAAGLTLRKGDYPRFAAAFAEEVGRLLDADALESLVFSDGEVAPADLCLETAQLLREAGPWGQSFPEPVFDGVFRIVQQRLLNDKHLKLVVMPLATPPGCDECFDAIAFNVQGHWPQPQLQQVHLVYRLDINEYRGRRAVQLLVEHLLPA